MFRSILAASFVLPAVLATYFVPPAEGDIAQCQEVTFEFKGAAPFDVAVWPGCDEDSDAEEPIAKYTSNSSSVSWVVNVKHSQSIMFGVTDKNGNEDYTEDFSVKASNNTACLGKTATFTIPDAFKSLNGTLPTTQASSLQPTAAVGNVGGEATPSVAPIGGLGNGAFSSFSVRSEVAVLAAVGSIASVVFF